MGGSSGSCGDGETDEGVRMTDTFDTLLYELRDGVAWVTLNRPEVMNAFNATMEQELSGLWRSMQRNDDVRCVVLQGAGDRAFCVGIDRDETFTEDAAHERIGYSTPWVFEGPGTYLGPKSNQFWKPVIAAVRGISCGGAFYLLGEADFIIASDDATFFDPHVTYQMTAAFEPVHLLQKMPLQEVLRMALLGAHERMTAQRAYEIGLVSQVVKTGELIETASWAAEVVASAPALNVQGTMRAIWMGNEIPRSQALGLCSLYSWIGSDPDALWGAQSDFHRKGKIKWRSR